MPGDNSATEKMVTSLEQIVSLLQQSSDERKAIAIGLGDQDWKEQRAEHGREIEKMKKEGEQHRAEQREFRVAVLKIMEGQLEVLRRIESSVQKSS